MLIGVFSATRTGVSSFNQLNDYPRIIKAEDAELE
jgi:hypothetical protein